MKKELTEQQRLNAESFKRCYHIMREIARTETDTNAKMSAECIANLIRDDLSYSYGAKP